MTYIHELKKWPDFYWDSAHLSTLLAEVRHAQGRLLGKMEALGFPLRAEAILETLTLDTLKSSEIEGEILDKEQVRSSIARRLGMDIAGLIPSERHIDGVVEMILDATQNFAKPLTDKRLYGWHAALFPTGYSGIHKITVAAYRNDEQGPMQVISGSYGREKIHYEAPNAAHLKKEMDHFLIWFEKKSDTDAVLKAALAHLWFVTIHPFDDGNGRIARAISDMALARSEKTTQRFYSMSAQIKIEHKEYYDILERTQKGDLDITAWQWWFLECLWRAINQAEETLASILFKAKFWEMYKEVSINERQRTMLNKLLDGFEGKLTSSKWAKITKCSQDTALRDITHLLEHSILIKDPGGSRSTSYSLNDLNNV